MSSTPPTSAVTVSETPRAHHRVALLVAAGIVLLILACYFQVHAQDFVNYDDDRYVTDNPFVLRGLSAEGIGFAFGVSSDSQYHPVAWLSHMLDVQLWGLDAGMHKLHNLLLHCINAVLVFLLLRRLCGSLWPAAIAAAAWAIHPLRVESVAWVSERREVLYAMFGLLALFAYLWYSEKRTLPRYALVYVLFILSLLSKPMLVTFPFLLLLFDYWPLKRFDLNFTPENRRRILSAVIDKLPMIPLIVASSLLTMYISRASLVSFEQYPLLPRLASASVSYIWYLQHTLLPFGLTAFYAHPFQYPVQVVLINIASLIVITVGVLIHARNHPYAVLGWFMFLGVLVPVSGVMQVGMQSYADRYSYFPTLGLFIIVACGLVELLKQHASRKPLIYAAAGLIVVVLAAFTWPQVGVWRNSETLWTHSLRVNEANYTAHNNLGGEYSSRADRTTDPIEKRALTEKALSHWRRANEMMPGGSAAANYANMLLQQGKNEEALPVIHAALERNPDDRYILALLATCQINTGQYVDAFKTLVTAAESTRTPSESTSAILDQILLKNFCAPGPEGPRLGRLLRGEPDAHALVERLIASLHARRRDSALLYLIAAGMVCEPQSPLWARAALMAGAEPDELRAQALQTYRTRDQPTDDNP